MTVASNEARTLDSLLELIEKKTARIGVFGQAFS